MEYTKVKYRKGNNPNELYAFVYYSNVKCPVGEKKELNIPTEIKVHPKYITAKTKELSEKTPDYSSIIKKIKEVKDRAEIIISNYYNVYKEKPLCSYLEEEMKKPVVIERKKLETITDYYDAFLIYKSDYVKDTSMGFYNNNVSCFEQFEKKKRKGEKIRFVDFELMSFWDEFISFMAYEKVDETRVKKPRQGMNNNTLTKRLKTITEFLRYVENYHDINLKYVKITDFIKKVKQKNDIKTYSVSKFSLTFDELQYLYNFTPSEYEQTKDMFVWLCLQGTRISDMMSFTDLDIIKRGGKYFIQKEAEKTAEEFKAELHPVSLEIWNKYKSFDIYEQDFNDKIKIVMKEFYLWYKEKYEERFDDSYELTTIKRVRRGTEIEKTRVFKWEMISSKYGRETFCTLLGSQPDKISLKEQMTLTGHKDMRVALDYQSPNRELSAEELLPLKKI